MPFTESASEGLVSVFHVLLLTDSMPQRLMQEITTCRIAVVQFLHHDPPQLRVTQVLGRSRGTWHVPFDTLPVIPRVGETICLPGGSASKVVEVDYELAHEGTPVDVAQERFCRKF
jgi:hypothetical protein